NNNAGPVDYGLAWWALGTGPALSMNGDFNFDGEINSADLSDMLNALTNLDEYKDKWGINQTDLLALGDINGDGAVTNADIQAELNLIASLSGSGALSAVPEPSSCLLFVFGIPLFKLARRRQPPTVSPTIGAPATCPNNLSQGATTTARQ